VHRVDLFPHSLVGSGYGVQLSAGPNAPDRRKTQMLTEVEARCLLAILQETVNQPIQQRLASWSRRHVRSLGSFRTELRPRLSGGLDPSLGRGFN
jgi:hypothetical protein